MLPPSKLEDCKKQFICNLSLLLNQDFETQVICCDEWFLFKKFAFEKELIEFMNALFKGTEPLYFDEIITLFSEDKIEEYQKMLKR